MKHDTGPWRMIVGNSEVTLYSDDFTHDVAITITGDFADNEQRIAYATDIQQRLSRGPQRRYTGEMK